MRSFVRFAATFILAALSLHAAGLTATGQIVSPGTPAEFSTAIDEQARHLAAVIKVLGLRPAQ